MTTLLNSKGVTTRDDAVWGNAFLGTVTVANYATYNPDVSFSGNWQISTGSTTTVGGLMFQNPASGTGSITFTPESNANSFDIYYATFPNNGGFSVADTSGNLANVDTNGVSGFGKVTVTRAANSTTAITISRWAGSSHPTTTFYVFGIVPYSTTTPALELWNMGYIGSQVSDWINNANGFNAGAAVQGIVADCWSVDLGANDANNSVSAATYQANLTTLLYDLGKGGVSDRFLIEVHPTNPNVGGGFNIPSSYRSAMVALAGLNAQISPVDFSNAGVGLTLSNYYDNIHLIASGYSLEAAYLYAQVKGPLGLPN